MGTAYNFSSGSNARIYESRSTGELYSDMIDHREMESLVMEAHTLHYGPDIALPDDLLHDYYSQVRNPLHHLSVSLSIHTKHIVKRKTLQKQEKTAESKSLIPQE